MQFIDLKTQYKRIEDGVLESIKKVLDHGQYILGPELKELETTLADYVGVKHAVGVSSGTDALLLALMALGVGAGDEVITTPFSFFASSEVIILLGAKPVFVDIDPETYNINASKIEQAITNKTKAIMPVGLFGQCADMDAINDIAKRHQLHVIEDGAQSFGGTYKNQKSGSLATISCTSFFPSKPLGCYGDGGGCFTDDDNLAKKLRQLLHHGQGARYKHDLIGTNGRLDTIQAAVLLEKLKIFDDEMKQRQKVAKHYQHLLEGVVKTPFIASYNESAFAQYTISVSNRQAVLDRLKEDNIPTAVHYPIPLHLQPAMSSLLHKAGDFPEAEAASLSVMSLPMSPYITEKEQALVAHALKKAVS
jgi:UDP-2-acetamido-2-deoxy-ribo-hexuluronate aminotransferase